MHFILKGGVLHLVPAITLEEASHRFSGQLKKQDLKEVREKKVKERLQRLNAKLI